MKTFPIFKIILLFIIFLPLHSCNNSQNLDSQEKGEESIDSDGDGVSSEEVEILDEEFENEFLSEEYIIELDNELNNSAGLNLVEKLLSPIPNETSNEKNQFNKVDLYAEVTKLFDPDNHPCGNLPRKVKRKLKKIKGSSNKGWAPRIIIDQFKRMPKSAEYLQGNSVALLLHTAVITKPDRTNFKIRVLGSPTYTNFDVSLYLDTKGYESFLYSLDCTGYLSASIEAAGVAPGADVKGAAKSALDNNTSIMVAKGTLYSPLLASLRPNYYGKILDDSVRYEVLKSIIGTLPSNLDQNSTIDLGILNTILWSSKRGESSFNGIASLDSKFGGGIGVASLNVSANAKSTLTRKVKYTNFDTFLLDSEHADEIEAIKISEIYVEFEKLKTKVIQ